MFFTMSRAREIKTTAKNNNQQRNKSICWTPVSFFVCVFFWGFAVLVYLLVKQCGFWTSTVQVESSMSSGRGQGAGSGHWESS